MNGSVSLPVREAFVSVGLEVVTVAKAVTWLANNIIFSQFLLSPRCPYLILPARSIIKVCLHERLLPLADLATLLHDIMAAAHAQSMTCCAGKGSLSYLQWNDQTCNKCGGNVNKLCVQATTGTDAQHSCASEACALLLRGMGRLRMHFDAMWQPALPCEFCTCQPALLSCSLLALLNLLLLMSPSEPDRLLLLPLGCASEPLLACPACSCCPALQNPCEHHRTCHSMLLLACPC